MPRPRTLSIAVLALFALAAAAQTPAGHTAHHPVAASAPRSATPADRMAQMDAHMQAMRSMHDRIVGARTPEQRQALMAEHLRLMQDGMAMMGGMGPGAGLGMGMMSGDKGAGSMPAGPMTPEMRQQMLEKRMEMMQSMMQMMMDRMPAPAPASK